MKPFKGEISNVEKYYGNHEVGKSYRPDFYGPNLGYVLTCRFVDHPYFKGERGHTSLVVSYDEATGDVETLNSRYKVIK